MSSLRRILIIAPQGLGDCIKATPLIEAVRNHFHEHRLDVAVLRPDAKAFFEGLEPWVDRVVYLPYWERGAAAFASAALKNALARSYDYSFLTYPAARSEYNVLTLLFHAKRRVAHRYFPERRERFQFANTILVPVRNVHHVERNLDLLRAVASVDVAANHYLVPETWKAFGSPSGRIAFHVGTVTHDGLSSKRWPSHKFIDLGRRLAEKGHAVAVIAGPEERAVSRDVVGAIPGAALVEGTLPEVARYLASCVAAVTNDSGIGHLAAAVGTPTIALHGPTEEAGGPFGPSAIRLRPSSCPACFDVRVLDMSCKRNIDFACLNADLPVDLVERTVLGAFESLSCSS